MEILKPTCFDSFFSRSTKPTENGEGSKGKQDKQVHVHDEQEKASDDADKDIGRLSKASCAVQLNTMSDEIENDWMEVKKGRRSGRNRQAFIRADHVEGPAESESCR